jgi:hypothetical protein
MTLSFFLLLFASVIFSYLGTQAKRAFHMRVCALLPRNVMRDHVKILFAEYPGRLPEFRAQALPVRAGRLALDALSCATLLVGLWAMPPAFLRGFDLALLRFCGLGLVLLAFAMDTAAFCKMAYWTWRGLELASQKTSKAAQAVDAESEI